MPSNASASASASASSSKKGAAAQVEEGGGKKHKPLGKENSIAQARQQAPKGSEGCVVVCL